MHNSPKMNLKKIAGDGRSPYSSQQPTTGTVTVNKGMVHGAPPHDKIIITF